MQFLKNNKVLIWGVLVAVVVVYAYFIFFRSDSSDPLLTSSSEAPAVSSGLLVTLSSLNIIRLNNEIFSDPVFLSLTDFGVQLDPQNVGRRNPFAPLGGN